MGGYNGVCVYANDATDIKAHPFFKGIKWSLLHTSRPPFIPKVKNWEDSQYFDDCCPLAGVNDAPAASDAVARESKADVPVSPLCENPLSELEPNQTACQSKPQNMLHDEAHKEMEKERLKKRPRDKILRDKEVGKAVLEIRKRGAFYGYTYHRPKAPVMAFSEQRARPCIPRGEMKELFGYH